MEANDQQQIFDEWLKEHRGLFFKVVRAYAFKPKDQEDLFQEIATQVWNSIPKFRNDSKVTTWIYRVALYSAMAWSKKERRYRDQHQPITGLENTLIQASKTKNPQLDWLYEQISQLDEVDRSLALMMLDGYSYKEIAATLGITETNVGVKVNRFKKRLTEKHKQEENHEL
jgi:RNA polymerase sigma-70 factor (ECF subfamily)